ncbi:O-acetyl-ADP-ribose deacetylase [Aquabacterium sp.]|uniref:O-acetyl-ADP-ribose deacetylase n=1 Tax=Aquabacterium sp. TaxID=1872578 RepID=UPI0040380B90
MATFQAIKGDITKLAVDAIVNAANSSLLGGGGVDGAIHRAAGPELLEACRKLNGCKTGQAKLTKGFKLPASHVIHTVGPVWQGGAKDEANLLAACYRECIALAVQHDIRSLAFSCISTGSYSFPAQAAAEIAVATAKEHAGSANIDITFCCFSERDLEIYMTLLR